MHLLLTTHKIEWLLVKITPSKLSVLVKTGKGKIKQQNSGGIARYFDPNRPQIEKYPTQTYVW